MTALADKVDPSLREALLRFAHAAEPDVVDRWVAWPEMAGFLRSIAALGKAQHRFAVNVSVEADLRRWFAARRLLRSSFIAPAHPDLGLMEGPSWGPLAEGELGEIQASARSAAERLVLGPHRSLEALQLFFVEPGRLRWPRPGLARVVAPNQAVIGTMEALESLKGTDAVTWEVCTLADAKRKPGCDVTVVPGSAEFFEGWRTEESLRPRRVSWLFNAPMSPHVVSIAWAGSRRFDSDRFEPYAGADVIDSRRWVDDDLDHVAVDESSPLPIAVPPQSSNRGDEYDELIECLDFELPDGNWISFGIDAGPLARRIDDDAEFSVIVESGVKATALRRGNTLVLLSSTADRALRDELCAKWLSEAPDRPTFTDASKTVQAYKSASRRYLARDEAVSELGRVGMTESYVRSQFFRSHPMSPAMAPQQYENFVVIADKAGWTPPDNAWAHIEALRGGYRHAGREIARKLAAAVASDVSWVDAIERRELASIEIAGVGTVTLAPVLNIAPQRSRRSIHSLGEMF